MESKRLKRTGILAILWILIALVGVTAATYAWFSFAPYTTVTPMTGTVAGGDGNLLISSDPNGPFDVSCELLPENPDVSLKPVTTADLDTFYVVSRQNAAGYATRYRKLDDADVPDHVLCGTVYLKSDESALSIYFDPEGLDFGIDQQALASMRLGLRFHTEAGTVTHIFSLDEMVTNRRDLEERPAVRPTTSRRMPIRLLPTKLPW